MVCRVDGLVPQCRSTLGGVVFCDLCTRALSWETGHPCYLFHRLSLITDQPHGAECFLRRRKRSLFIADQAGQSAVGLGTEPCLGLLTRCLLSLTFTLWNLLSVIPAGTTGLSSFFFVRFVCFYFYYHSFAVA